MPLLNLGADRVGIFRSQTWNRASRHSQLLRNERIHPFRSPHRGNRRRARSLQKLSARRIFRIFLLRHQILPATNFILKFILSACTFIPFYFLTALPSSSFFSTFPFRNTRPLHALHVSRQRPLLRHQFFHPLSRFFRSSLRFQ